MTGLLVSVRDADEALLALGGGASIVDVKEPKNGSLGAASAEHWARVIAACRGRIPLSLALGELIEDGLSDRLRRVPPVEYAKVGLAGCRHLREWGPRWRWAIEQLPAATSAVAVTYADADAADAPDADAICREAREIGCCAMLWDTYDKSRGDLLDHLSVAQLADQVTYARQSGMIVVLAGSLTAPRLKSIAPLAPDFVAVRGAVCETSRMGRVRADLVTQLVDAVRTLGSDNTPGGVANQ